MSQRETFDGVHPENLLIWKTRIFRGKPQVTEYLDASTGQLIPAAAAQRAGVRTIRSDARIRRKTKLDRLRPEPRQFATFLLRFRDVHCKFLMPVETLISWFSALHGKQRGHVRRYFKPLIEAGILDSETSLNEDFMVSNPAAGKETSKGDEARAYRLYEELRLKQKR